jgi:hypothetical protein
MRTRIHQGCRPENAIAFLDGAREMGRYPLG